MTKWLHLKEQKMKYQMTEWQHLKGQKKYIYNCIKQETGRIQETKDLDAITDFTGKNKCRSGF